MSRAFRVFVVTVVLAVTMVLGAGPVFASDGPAFPLPTFQCFSPPSTEFGLGTGIDTPGAATPCVRPGEVGPPADDIIIE
jgi:hypothetical protein